MFIENRRVPMKVNADSERNRRAFRDEDATPPKREPRSARKILGDAGNDRFASNSQSYGFMKIQQFHLFAGMPRSFNQIRDRSRALRYRIAGAPACSDEVPEFGPAQGKTGVSQIDRPQERARN
jgi:hypothetical protein